MLRSSHLDPTKPPTVIKFLKITKMHWITLTQFYHSPKRARVTFEITKPDRFVEKFNRILITLRQAIPTKDGA